MTLRTHPCLASHWTAFTASHCFSFHPVCAVSGPKHVRSSATSHTLPAVLRFATERAVRSSLVHPFSFRAYSTSRSVIGASSSMVVPEILSPAPSSAPKYDKDGKELSKSTKRKVAVVVGYVGTKFHGWQKCTNNDVRTVEGDLETALWKSGAIADSNYGDITKIGWGRTSRTDKGVHASKTVAAVKLLYPPETYAEDGFSQYAKDTLNENLPDDVRCFSVCKVPKSFRGREECNLRAYSYYLPKHLLPEEATEKFQSLLNEFVGTHSFHNFASMKSRQLKDVRKRVQASIDRDNVYTEGKGEIGNGEDGGAAAAASVASVSAPAATGSGEDEPSAGNTRERSKEWKTWRHKKKSALEQHEDDAWYHKDKPSQGEGEAKPTSASAEEESASAASTPGYSVNATDSAQTSSAAESVTPGNIPNVESRNVVKSVEVSEEISENSVAGSGGSRVETEHEAGLVAVDGDATGDDDDGNACQETGEDRPVKALLLRELRTSIYVCEMMEGVVRLKRSGEEQPEEFIRIDIRGKAFVYNQIRLMIGGALCEARKELFPGFVVAALNVPYKLRVPLAPAEGLVLESQVFTRYSNALVLDPRELASVGGTLAKWGDNTGSTPMKTVGRLQTLLTSEQLAECEKWRDDHIVPAVAEAWATSDAAAIFLETFQKYFAGKQQGKELLAAVKEHMDTVEENERAAEEKHNRFRVASQESGSTRYKDLLPKNAATRIICKFRLLPGNKVSAIQNGVAIRIAKGQLPVSSNIDQVLQCIQQIGVDEMAIEGGFNRSDIVKL